MITPPSPAVGPALREHRDRVERFVRARYPEAAIAVVAGSTARGERTTTSDIDLLLIGDGLFGGAKTSEASTHVFEDEVFEVFAYTHAGFDEWAARSVANLRPVIVDMLVAGVAVRDDGDLAGLRSRWRAVLDGGPRLSDADERLRRYVITDLLGDLRDATDPLEQRVVASLLFERVAELMLLSAGRWIGTGKWLPRRLRELDPSTADRLSAPLLADDYATFADRAEETLENRGGRLQNGFVR